jgi:Fe2+ or Zn2+ uptake regulation protein
MKLSKELIEALEAAADSIYRSGWDDALAALQKARPNGAGAPLPKRPTMAQVASRITAREAVQQALQERPGMQAAEIGQWTEAKSMDVTFAAIRTAIKRLRKQGAIERRGVGYALSADVAPTPKAPAVKKVWKEPPPDTDAWRVLNAIRTNPGLTATELKVIAEGRGQAIKLKTFRQSLRRLEERGFAHRKEGRWHPARL